jgi:glycosyltransferase involved in cell wall biosynthesis
VEQQSVMELLVKKGHTVFLLTISKENYLHHFVKGLGVQAFASPYAGQEGYAAIFKNAFYLIKFCKKNKIDLILAHQQLTALPAIIASPFIKSKIYYIRHNADEDYKIFPKKAWMMNKFINTMLPHIIAPSDMVYKFMTEVEGVPTKKMLRINYGYNFYQYDKPVQATVNEIREKHDCDFLILSIARLAPPKRHSVMFDAVKTLVAKGLNIKMICLGDGGLKEPLQQWINENGLTGTIYLAGIQSNIFDYLYAADILLHLSETEASNSAVKEAGLAKKTVIVCRNVGDFSDYIIHNQNGFLVNKESPLAETIALIEKYYHDRNALIKMAENLYNTVGNTFDIDKVSLQYDEIINYI